MKYQSLNNLNITPLPVEIAIRLAWTRGLLEYKLLGHQKSLYKIISNVHKKKNLKTLINCTRRFGKTTTLLIYALVFAIKNPGSLIRFITSSQKALRKIVFPILRDLLKDCPPDLKPKFNTMDGCYKFPNGTELHLHGTDAQQFDSMRGQRTDLAVIDEAAFCSDLKTVVQDIILPQFITCNGRAIISSTPEKNTTQSGEEFKEFCAEAELNGCYYKRIIYDNSSISKIIIDQWCKESGGKDSVTWLVEYMCEFLVDPEKRIVPEWATDDMVLDYMVTETKDPHHQLYHRYVGIDLGVTRDFTVMLFGYYNFKLARLFIQDEVVTKNVTTDELADHIRNKESLYFTNPPYRRVADNNNPQLVLDMASNHNLPIIPTNKDTLEAMVNEMRIFIGDGRLHVHPRCKFLISNLEHGVWATSVAGQAHKDFARTITHGHFDAIAALNYLIRNLDTTSNPIPSLYNVDPYNNSSYGYQPPSQGISAMFTRKRK